MNEPLAIFRGTLSHHEVKTHLEFSFEVPEAIQGLEFTFDFAPAKVGEIRNMICLSLFDPDRFRGSGHRHGSQHQVGLGATYATPGYLPGILPPGTWRVLAHAHMIMPGEPLTYSLSVTATDAAAVQRPPEVSLSRPVGGSGWYRGNLHAHSDHSDASWTVEDLIRDAQRYELDFVTLSDHNTTSGLAEMASRATPELLTIDGLELTTFYGHALALGRREWLDWITEPMSVLATRADAEGLFVIAHPRVQGDPVCTGCRWEYLELMPGAARATEVWNRGTWSDSNEEALALWYEWLNAGHRLVATAGTDAHGPAPEGSAVGFNVVYAEALTEAAILKAVREGRSYLSSGPLFELVARSASGEEVMTGEVIDLPATLALDYAKVPAGARVRHIANGQVSHQASLAGEGRFELPVPAAARWCVLELRARDGTLLALTNPVFTPAFA